MERFLEGGLGESKHHVYVVFGEIDGAPKSDLKGACDEDFCPFNIEDAALNVHVDRGEPHLEGFVLGEIGVFEELEDASEVSSVITGDLSKLEACSGDGDVA